MIAVMLLAICPFRTQHNPTNKHQQEAKESPTPSAMLQIQPTPAPEKDSSQRKQDDSLCERLSDAFVSQWPLVAIGVATLFVIGYQAREMVRATRAMRESTEVARKNVQALVDSERAWLLGSPDKLPDMSPTNAVFYFYTPIKNYGKSVGRIVKTSATCKLHRLLPTEPDYQIQGECDIVLAPSGVHKLWGGLAATDLDHVREKREQRLYFYGFVQYFDIGAVTLRETRFCYVYHVHVDYLPDPEGFYPDANAPPAYTKCT